MVRIAVLSFVLAFSALNTFSTEATAASYFDFEAGADQSCSCSLAPGFTIEVVTPGTTSFVSCPCVGKQGAPDTGFTGCSGDTTCGPTGNQDGLIAKHQSGCGFLTDDNNNVGIAGDIWITLSSPASTFSADIIDVDLHGATFEKFDITAYDATGTTSVGSAFATAPGGAADASCVSSAAGPGDGAPIPVAILAPGSIHYVRVAYTGTFSPSIAGWAIDNIRFDLDPIELNCFDTIDNDGDGRTDCADLDCDGIGICEYPESSCSDTFDNDNDGLTDCDDPDCQGVSGCPEIECDDGVDNDGNGDTDCGDANCDGVGICEFPESTCNDALDNDDDGDTDCADTDCDGVGTCENPESTCNDAIDNDDDGDTDCADPDCDGIGICEYPESTCNDSLDNDGDGDVDCQDLDCNGVGSCEIPESTCNDSIDNDGDGDTDCSDTDCQGVDGCPEIVCDDSVDNDSNGDTDCADSNCYGTCLTNSYSVDFQGPTVATGVLDSFSSVAITEGDILTTGPPPAAAMPAPGIAISGSASPIGLVPGGLGILPTLGGHVEIDALSYGRDDVEELALMFSVDEFATGIAGPSPPDVLTEGSIGSAEASADVFRFLGPVGPAAPGLVGSTAIRDGDGVPPTGLAGVGLIEPNVPTLTLPDNGDNLDAVDLNTTFLDLLGPIFFSMDGAFSDALEPGTAANSGSAAANGFLGGDVVVTPSPGSAPMLYAAATSLGLDLSGAGTDDLDALALQSDGDLIFTPGDVIASPATCGDPGVDCILFSVRRGSALIGTLDSLLGLAIGEGDILTNPVVGGSPPRIYIAAEALGLSTARSLGNPDDLNALDVPEPSRTSMLLIGAGGLLLVSKLRERRQRGRTHASRD